MDFCFSDNTTDRINCVEGMLHNIKLKKNTHHLNLPNSLTKLKINFRANFNTNRLSE